MARPPIIDQEDVANAISELRETGKPINPYQVKKILGQGSEAKIAYYLQALDINYDLDDEDPLTKRLSNLVRPIAIELNEQKLNQVSEVKKRFEEELAVKNSEIEDLLAYHSDKEEEINALKTDLIELNAIRNDLQTNLKLSSDEIQSLKIDLKTEEGKHQKTKAQLQAKVEAVAESEKQKKHLTKLHANTVDTLKDQHSDQIQQHKDIEEGQRSQIELLNQELLMLRKINSDLHESNNSLKTQSSVTTSQLEQALSSNKDLNAQVKALEREIYVAGTRITELEHSVTQKESFIDQQKSVIESSSDKLMLANKEVESLNKNMLSITNAHSTLESKYHLLESIVNKLSSNKSEGA